MGMFDFLKKSKEAPDRGLELPPVPRIEGMGVESTSETVSEETSVGETALPPLPTEVPGQVPQKPEESEIETPRVELPEPPTLPEVPLEEPKKVEVPPEPLNAPLPEMPEPPSVEMEKPVEEEKMEPVEEPMVNVVEPDIEEMESPLEKPEFPAPLEMHEDMLPDKIPPLEGLPEAPEFKPADVDETIGEKELPEPVIEPEEMPSYSPYEKPSESVVREIRGSLFIRTDKFKRAIEHIEEIKTKFQEEDDTFFRITEVKSVQDQRFESFRESLEDVQRKLLFIDRSLFEAA